MIDKKSRTGEKGKFNRVVDINTDSEEFTQWHGDMSNREATAS
jgi:hypothetical protein